MSKILVLCADNVEEVECLTVVDFCRRAGILVVTASVTGDSLIHGHHGINFATDVLFKDVEFSGFDAVVYPGGGGTKDLGNVPGVKELAVEFSRQGKLVAAICAAPGMLSSTGLLKGKIATGYPGCNPEGAANWTENLTERDGNIITGKGPGAAALFAVEIIRYLEGEAKALEIRSQTMML